MRRSSVSTPMPSCSSVSATSMRRSATMPHGRHRCVPFHAYESYVGKLLRAGLKVALCDQVEQAGEARGLVRREVIRVLTPGTVVEDAYLDGGGTNYAVAVCLRTHFHGIAALDCSTGELALLRVEPTDDALRDELTRLRRV